MNGCMTAAGPIVAATVCMRMLSAIVNAVLQRSRRWDTR